MGQNGSRGAINANHDAAIAECQQIAGGSDNRAVGAVTDQSASNAGSPGCGSSARAAGPSSVTFRVGDEHDAASLVRRFHYSARAAAAVQAVGTWHLPGGLFGDRGEAVAACAFSIPPTRWSENVLELSRLVRAEGVALPPLSGLIAATVRFLKQTKKADLLVSFADAQQRHHGGIYQAASWNYDGQRERAMDGLIIDGTFHAGRSCNSRWGTRSPVKLRLVLPHSVIEPHYDEGKHLYWKAVTKEGARMAGRLGLKVAPYIKPRMTKIISEGAA